MHLRRPSPASIIASLALFVALGGTAIAARHYLITSTSQIKPSVLKELRGNAGANGATHVVVRFAEAITTNGSRGKATASCNAGERATGGGVEVVSGNAAKVWYLTSGGVPTPRRQGATSTGWFGEWFNESGSTDTLHVYAVCASP